MSPATVSRVLNDFRRVRATTRARVLDAIAELDFHADPAARGLKTARSRAVALLFHHSQYPFAAGLFGHRVMQGAETALAARGYDLIVATLGDDELSGPMPRLVRDRRADGYFVLGPTFPWPFIEALAARAPVVLVDNRRAAAACDVSVADDRTGGRLAAAHLLREHRRRRLLFLGGPRSWASTRARAAGARDAVQALGAELAVAHARGTTIAEGEAAAVRELRRRPETDGLVGVNDAIAIGAVRAARRLDLAVPDRLAVTGFDDTVLAAYSEPALTTIHVDAEALGATAARRLLGRIDGDDGPAATDVGDVALVVRASCGCAGTTHLDPETPGRRASSAGRPPSSGDRSPGRRAQRRGPSTRRTPTSATVVE